MSNKKLENLIKSSIFYSESENKLFTIPKLYVGGMKTIDRCNHHHEVADHLAKLSKTDPNNVGSYLIERSRRYKGMHLYYVSNPVEVPANAFRMSGDWNSFSWAHD